jgi:hypothetical protein
LFVFSCLVPIYEQCFIIKQFCCCSELGANTAIVEDSRLREMCFGDMQGKTRAQLKEVGRDSVFEMHIYSLYCSRHVCHTHANVAARIRPSVVKLRMNCARALSNSSRKCVEQSLTTQPIIRTARFHHVCNKFSSAHAQLVFFYSCPSTTRFLPNTSEHGLSGWWPGCVVRVRGVARGRRGRCDRRE